jgi:hypothetical protein
VPFTFSKKLIDECIKCFKEENGIDISIETAVEFLNAFAGLFLAFSKGCGAGGTMSDPQRRSGS